MNSALKPVLPQPGPQPGGQASPAKGNVATVNHAVGHPQGAQNSLHHGTNNLVGQNLSHHQQVVQPPPTHAPPSMAPVPANMVQMAQNMSHHGNLSHVQNTATPANTAASPSKSATTSSPLSLVQDKVVTSQPLALTRTPEKKEPDVNVQANGTIDSPKSGPSTPNQLKPQNSELNKEKQDIAKTSPSTPKPPEKPTGTPVTPLVPETSNSVVQSEAPAQPKVTATNELPEIPPVKPTAELKPAPTADVAPMQSDNKPIPESAKDSQQNSQEKAVSKQEPAKDKDVGLEKAELESSTKVEEKKEPPPKIEKEIPPSIVVEKKEEPQKLETLKKEAKVIEEEKIEEKVDEKKPETKAPVRSVPEVKPAPKSTLKLATVTTPVRKRRQTDQNKSLDGPSSTKKSTETDGTPDSRTKRNRTKVQLYQSPTPELTMATKLSASAGRSTPTKQNDDKLIVFYKNEYLAVRNAEGGFYVCQALQNVYRTTRKIKIRWLSQDKTADPSGETYKPDFYDTTDIECVLTTLSLSRATTGTAGGGALLLKTAEAARARSILERALRAEQGNASLDISEEHPDGLDLSLFTDESQLEKKSRKRNISKSSPRGKQDTVSETAKTVSPSKKARTTPKRSPKSPRKPIKQTTPKPTNNKRKSSGSTPIVANTSKTATAVTEKSKSAGRTRAKPSKPETPVKVATPTSTPVRQGRRNARDSKSSPIVPTPSTSTGKTTRTPRKPPAKK